MTEKQGAGKKRSDTSLDEHELDALLQEGRVANVATNDPTGWPHLVPLWYVPKESAIWIWTYAKSQKVMNIERDPRVTVMVEAGTEYGELRGAMFRTRATVRDDHSTVVGIGIELYERFFPKPLPEELLETIRRQARKRVAIELRRASVVSWDHRKLR